MVITAVALCAALAAGVAVLGLVFGSDEQTGQTKSQANSRPLTLPTVPAPQARSPQCAKVMRALPKQLNSAGEKLRKLPIARPAPPATTAWGGTAQEPLILRCGLQRPTELVRTSPLREISDVRWLVLERPGTSSWYAVDRGVYVVLTLPSDTGTGPLQTVSKVLRDTLPATPLRFK